ncbi:C4-dicarboxylate ABC transporter [Nitrosomonas sp. JL21]|uniref:C4-dicarboxylate ABC transporter n=1 Tax=Nitrosomonas sp. JL21 TaxID=153949 RepID=UPI00136824D8|nr:C4-dicarboxylate ABC transporter [Nitrosomonas sp. JL21]MBL8498643.1 C4-dicarboxylate ABC transporter [Nitrosomonas sp.]MCC7091089.1 C4-dicarboxylate ABC transporter [Nitrosomonas sp.]MXS79042.1 C4-dicarboxylate ABC transporter [Nitrosomonas sp. JL21]
MKTSQVFAMSAVVITTTFFGILSIFELPQSVMDWVISDIILGIILYLGYLGAVVVSGPSKTRLYDSAKKVTA